jgi:HrpA-like RNA helicase
MLYDSSFLSYDYVIIDEPHEKLIDTDVVISFMMLILNELVERNETKPKFILSSASMDYNYMKAVFLA